MPVGTRTQICGNHGHWERSSSSALRRGGNEICNAVLVDRSKKTQKSQKCPFLVCFGTGVRSPPPACKTSTHVIPWIGGGLRRWGAGAGPGWGSGAGVFRAGAAAAAGTLGTGAVAQIASSHQPCGMRQRKCVSLSRSSINQKDPSDNVSERLLMTTS